MHVVLVREGFSPIHIPDVTLRDGFQPAVGKTVAESDSIEPARWFKTLIIDYLTIDCIKRLVKWDRDDSLPNLTKPMSAQLKRTSRVLFSEGEFYDYEAKCDELFDKVYQCFDRDNTLGDISSILLKTLHCHVLPNTHLEQEDVPKLEEAREKQESYITKLEGKVEVLMAALSRHEDCLQKYRCTILGNIYDDPADIANFDLSILEVLKDHIQKDIYKCSETLDEYGNAVVAAKQSLAEDPDNRSLSWELKQKRLTRDAFYRESYESLLNIREMISEELAQKRKGMLPTATEKRKTLIVWPKRSRPLMDVSGGKEVLHHKYVKTSLIQKDTKQQMKNLINKKVLMVSVKEAISMSIKDLKGSQQSVGRSSCRCTDVLNRSTISSDWLTFEEKISDMVANSEHAVGSKHETFCKKVEAICKAAYEEETDYRTSQTANTNTLKQMQVPAGTTRCFTEISKSHASVCDMETIKKLKVLIKDHFEEICPMICSYVNISSRDKTWVTYENNFYERVMPHLVALYKSVYRDSSETLKLQSSSLTVENLKIEESWLLDMLLKRRDGRFDSGREDDEQTYEKTVSASSEFEQLHKMFIPNCNQATSVSNVPASELSRNDTAEPSNVLLLANYEKHNSCDVVINEPVKMRNQHVVGGHRQLCRSHRKVSVFVATAAAFPEDDARDVSDGNVSGEEAHIPAVEQEQSSFTTDQSTAKDETDGCNDTLCESVDTDTEIQDFHLLSTGLHHSNQQSNSNMGQTESEYEIQSQTFKSFFESAQTCLIESLAETTPLRKMQLLTRCMREITASLSKLDGNNRETATCVDDLVTVLVVLLLNCGPVEMSRLHIDVCLVIDLMAPFLESGIHSCSLTNIYGAFYFMFSKLLEIKNRKVRHNDALVGLLGV